MMFAAKEFLKNLAAIITLLLAIVFTPLCFYSRADDYSILMEGNVIILLFESC